ncbi:hypothetical protein Tco_0873094, partial [Tanacetum coccineum]
EFNLFFDPGDQCEEEATEAMTKPTMEEYVTKTRKDYESGIARLKINDKAHFELKGQFLKELRDNTFSGSDNEDANKHIEKLLRDSVRSDSRKLFLEMSSNSLKEICRKEILFFQRIRFVPLEQFLEFKGCHIPSMKVVDAKKAI